MRASYRHAKLGHAAGNATRMIHDPSGAAGGVCSQGAAADGRFLRRLLLAPAARGTAAVLCGHWLAHLRLLRMVCVVRGRRRDGERLRRVQPELKAVLQPYGADRVSACGARAAAC